MNNTKELKFVFSEVKQFTYPLSEKCPYWKLFWSVFFGIRTEYLVRMRENTDQKNSEYGHFSRSNLPRKFFL